MANSCCHQVIIIAWLQLVAVLALPLYWCCRHPMMELACKSYLATVHKIVLCISVVSDCMQFGHQVVQRLHSARSVQPLKLRTYANVRNNTGTSLCPCIPSFAEHKVFLLSAAEMPETVTGTVTVMYLLIQKLAESSKHLLGSKRGTSYTEQKGHVVFITSTTS